MPPTAESEWAQKGADSTGDGELSGGCHAGSAGTETGRMARVRVSAVQHRHGSQPWDALLLLINSDSWWGGGGKPSWQDFLKTLS